MIEDFILRIKQDLLEFYLCVMVIHVTVQVWGVSSVDNMSKCQLWPFFDTSKVSSAAEPHAVRTAWLQVVSEFNPPPPRALLLLLMVDFILNSNPR